MTTERLPGIVTRALRASLEAGFVDTTRTETGRLLATLAASADGPIADFGTGCGVGAAWLRWGAPSDLEVFTVESDAGLARRALDVFGSDAITVLHGDWSDLAGHGPFALLSAGEAVARQDVSGAMIDLLRPGGIAVIDDLAPRGFTSSYDPVRHCWLDDPRLVAAEVPVSIDACAIVATKSRDARI